MPWNCQRKKRKREERRRERAAEIEGKVWKRREMRRWLEDEEECPFGEK